MEKLNELVYIYRPLQGASMKTDDQPRMIIISSWTDAKDTHIVKYIARYQALYPAAQILLLKSTLSCILRPSNIGPAMKDAASAIRTLSLAPRSSSPAPLLIHMFSNGGSSSIVNLYHQYAVMARPKDDKRLPPHVTIFDSCPGLFRIPCAVAFVTVGLPMFQQLIATPFLYAVATLWGVSMILGIIPSSLSEWYKAHNHDPSSETEMRRAYIYSAADALIDFRDVEEHAAEARTRGYTVALEKYDGSAHVAHSRKDDARYWEIVRQVVQG